MAILKYIIIFLLFPGLLSAQGIYRIKGEFSIKSKENNYSQLVIGTFYYDLNSQQIIYRNSFPEKEVWITSDTTLYHIVNDEILSTQIIPDFSKFSIYHLALTRNLKNFGIDENSFKLDKVEQDGDLVISTFLPQKEFKAFSGKVMISTKDGKLFGIVFFDPEDIIVKKQFFEDYITERGLPFPGKITEIFYKKGGEEYKVTNYKNIIYNANEPMDLYYFDADKYFSEK